MISFKQTLVGEFGQGHLFPPNAAPEDEHRLLEKLKLIDQQMSGGLRGYIHRARALLEESRTACNAYEGFLVKIPKGSALTPGTAAFFKAEERGLQELGACVFVFVAGGLGERLGFAGIKLGLPVEVCTGMTYAEFYVQHILCYQMHAHTHTDTHAHTHTDTHAHTHTDTHANTHTDTHAHTHADTHAHTDIYRIPLVIMTSDDTHDLTKKLFEENDFFGLESSQIHFLKQNTVPALADNEGRLATRVDDPFALEMKPHGHGDVHALLHESGLIDKFAAKGFRWILFNQDTNALIFKSIPAALGVSATDHFVMNTIALPRKPGEAVGSICRLVSDTEDITINVEYNNLVPLLQANGSKCDAASSDGFSAYPGNTNSFIVDLPRYAQILRETHGHVPEFVNPKYKDSSRTVFKTPTRLESLMQDLPRLFKPEDKVGFVALDRWVCFSPVKNNNADAILKMADSLAPECALSAEADLYNANAQLLRCVGLHAHANIQIAAPQPVTFLGITFPMGPRILLMPSWALTTACMREKIKNANIRIADNSVLILEGDIIIKNLDLDGALVLRAAAGARLEVRDLVVRNEGWQLCGAGECEDKAVALRGFCFKRNQTAEYAVEEGVRVIC